MCETRGLLNKISRANIEQKEVEACVFTSIHNTAYFSNYIYCSMALRSCCWTSWEGDNHIFLVEDILFAGKARYDNKHN